MIELYSLVARAHFMHQAITPLTVEALQHARFLTLLKFFDASCEIDDSTIQTLNLSGGQQKHASVDIFLPWRGLHFDHRGGGRENGVGCMPSRPTLGIAKQSTCPCS
jgi:hypothetical protein